MSVTDLSNNLTALGTNSVNAKNGSVLRMINRKGELFVGNGTQADYLEPNLIQQNGYVLTKDSAESVGAKWAAYPTNNFEKNLISLNANTSLDATQVNSLILLDGVATLDLPETSTLVTGNRFWIVSKNGSTTVSAALTGTEIILKEDNSPVLSVTVSPESRALFFYTGVVGEQWRVH